MIRSHFKKFATLSLSAALFAGIGITATASATTASPASQATLSVSNSSLTSTALQSVTVTEAGGSGTGAVSFAVAGTGCSINATTGFLTDSVAGKCAVTVTKAATSAYKVATVKATFTFAAASQATLTISNASPSTGIVNTPIGLTTSGGSGNGSLKYALATGQSLNCGLKDGELSSKAPGTCAVTVTKAKDTAYAVATSAPVTFTFSYTNQIALAITNTGAKGSTAVDSGYQPIQDGILTSVGTKVTVTTSGGSGTGKTTFTATTVTGTAGSCAVTSDGSLTAAHAAVCSVVADKAASGVYGAQSSAAAKFIFQPLANVITLVQTGTTKSSITVINNTTAGDTKFIDAYFAPADHWYQSYINAGSATTLVFLVTDTKGIVQKSAQVTLVDGLAYSGAPGTQTFLETGLNAPNCGGGCMDDVLTGTTNSSGLVSFTLHNTNTFASTVLKPNDTTTGGGAQANENSGLYPWNRFLVVNGSPSAASVDALFTENLAYSPIPSVTQTTDLVDLITIPASAKTAQAPLSITNTTVSGLATDTYTVTTSGGSGMGAVTLAVTGANCTLTAGVLSYSGNAGTCSVVATKAADSTYAATSSSAVVFKFGTVDAPTNTNPDVATLTSVTGTNGAQLDNTAAGDIAFINQYYNPNDHWFLNYLVAGSTITETWHVTGSNGQVLRNTAVSLIVNQNYSNSAGTTWSDSGVSGSGATIAGTTNGAGNVTFTLHNTNSVSGYNPAVLNDPAIAASQEGAYPWTRTTLQVGSDDFSDGNTANIVQQTDEVDLIVIPGVTAPACGNHCPTTATPDVASLTSVTGITGSTLDDSVAGASEFINQFFLAGDSWTQSYLAEGATVVEKWHVSFNGAPLANTAVTLYDNQAYSGSQGTSWSNAALNVNNGTKPGGSLSGTTDASGNVSFTLVNTNTETGTAPTNDELTTTGANTGAELYEKTAPLWTRTYLVVGNDTFGAGGNQKTDFTDLIVIPATATGNPCASVTTPTVSCPVVASLTAVTGTTGGQVDNTPAGSGFLNSYYTSHDHWYLNVIGAGSTVTETWHVANPDGSADANTHVSFIVNQNYSQSSGTTWSDPTLNGIGAPSNNDETPNGPNGELQGILSGTTDASGNVTFTLVNTNTSPITSADTTTAASLQGSEGNGTTGQPWTRTTLQVGSLSFNVDPTMNVEVTDLVDLIVNP
jgi:hypothetical protein